MSDQFLTDDPEEGDLTLDPPAGPEPPRRSPQPTPPTARPRPTPVSPFRRLVSREIAPAEAIEEIDALDPAPGVRGQAASWDTAEGRPTARIQNQALPALQRNKMADLFGSVHHSGEPEALENRVTTALRFSAVGALVLVVGLVLASMYFFRAKPAGGVTDAPAAPAPAPSEPQTVNVKTEVAEAAAALGAFLATAGPAERQRLIGVDEPMPAFLGAPGPVRGLDKARFSADGARVVRIGSEIGVLVPMIDNSGVARTAALLKRGDGYRVDWRSVVTPEAEPWNEFVAAPTPEPRLFRVELSGGTEAGDPGLKAHRPTGDPATVAVTLDPRSRVGADLLGALRGREGKPLPADVFLEGRPDGRLRIVGWAPDKWAF